MDYARLNQIRLTNVHLSAESFDITGEATAAYVPALGLTQFTRRIQLAKPNQVVVSDIIKTSAPHHFSEVLHTDTTFASQSDALHTTAVGADLLHVDGGFSVPFSAIVEPNIVMGPGRPGSVDKGTPEERGERLVMTTKMPVLSTEAKWSLTF
jgi:hypothetical protein